MIAYRHRCSAGPAAVTHLHGGPSIPTSPVLSVSTVFGRVPLRTLPSSLTTWPFFS